MMKVSKLFIYTLSSLKHQLLLICICDYVNEDLILIYTVTMLGAHPSLLSILIMHRVSIIHFRLKIDNINKYKINVEISIRLHTFKTKSANLDDLLYIFHFMREKMDIAVFFRLWKVLLCTFLLLHSTIIYPPLCWYFALHYRDVNFDAFKRRNCIMQYDGTPSQYKKVPI